LREQAIDPAWVDHGVEPEFKPKVSGHRLHAFQLVPVDCKHNRLQAQRQMARPEQFDALRQRSKEPGAPVTRS